MADRKSFSVGLAPTVSKRTNNAYWASDVLTITDIMRAVGSIQGKLTINQVIDNGVTTLLIEPPYDKGKFTELKKSENGQYSSVSVGIWENKGTKKNGEAYEFNSSMNFDIEQMRQLLGEKIN